MILFFLIITHVTKNAKLIYRNIIIQTACKHQISSFTKTYCRNLVLMDKGVNSIFLSKVPYLILWEYFLQSKSNNHPLTILFLAILTLIVPSSLPLTRISFPLRAADTLLTNDV